MGDYPLGIDGKGKPGGVVRFLEDIDGDGRYDKQTTFLESLGFPTGVMPWPKECVERIALRFRSLSGLSYSACSRRHKPPNQ